MNRARGLAIILAVGLIAIRTARADDVLVLHVDVAVQVDSAALRAELARDLGRTVQLGDGGAEALSIEMRDGEAEVRFVGPDGARTRRVSVPIDRVEARAVLVLIAANLVRDPTDQLVVAPTESEVPAPPPEPTTPATQTPGRETEPEPEPEPSFAVSHPLQLGLEVLGGAASTADGARGYWYLGMDLMGTLHPAIRFGVTRLTIGVGVSSIDGLMFSAQGTPTFELFGFVDRHVQVYGQLGVAVQGRTQTALREGILQIAPYLGGGTRFWITDWFTIGVDIGLHLVATDSFLMGDVALPQGSIAGSAGLSVGFHLMP